MSSYIMCDVGRYSQFLLQTSCTSCPPGHYQNVTGQAFCRACKRGTYSTISGANSSALCQECPVGKVSDKDGMGTCTTCPKGQYQTSTGKSECMECTEVDETFTSNNDHTGCIRNEALYHDSIVEVMFSTGGALYVSFGISAFFTIVCGFMQYNRENAPEDSVGQIKRWQVFVKSAPQGFSFGSEMFLVSAMLYTSPGIAAVMIIFRIVHPV